MRVTVTFKNLCVLHDAPTVALPSRRNEMFNLQTLKNRAVSMGANVALVTGATLMSMSQAQAAFTLPVELTDALASVAIVGAAVFAIGVGVKLYKWIKGAL